MRLVKKMSCHLKSLQPVFIVKRYTQYRNALLRCFSGQLHRHRWKSGEGKRAGSSDPLRLCCRKRKGSLLLFWPVALLRSRKRAGRPTGAAAAALWKCYGSGLHEAEVAVLLGRVGHSVERPVGPVQVADWHAGASAPIAALDGVHHVGKLLALPTSPGRSQVGTVVACAKLADPYRCLAVGHRSGVAPGIAGVAKPLW